MRYFKLIISISSIIFLFTVIFVLYNKNSHQNSINIQSVNHVMNNPNALLINNNLNEENLDSEEKNTISLYARVSRSVVNITYSRTEMVSFFFDSYPQKSEGQGSGVIVDAKEGYIITNYHVVGNADRLSVALTQNDDIYDAKIIGVDPENDLAVIKILNPPKGLVEASFFDKNTLKVGQKVYAIGNPFGLDRTLTAGIISAIGRPIKTNSGNIIEGAIQTDASINPGNSGGPLINSSGLVIGINTMIISPTGGSVGVGFAIPVNTILDLYPDLIKFGYVKRGWIDATFLPLSQRIASYLGYSINHGLMIMSVAKSGEADRAGLKGGNERAIYGTRVVYLGGDIITKIDNFSIKEYSDLSKALKYKKPDELVDVEYVRAGKSKHKTKIKLIDKQQFIGKY